jgi:hypothetical protein
MQDGGARTSILDRKINNHKKSISEFIEEVTPFAAHQGNEYKKSIE